MDDAITRLHDATLVSIHLDWEERKCEVSFAGAPGIAGPFSLLFDQVAELRAPIAMPWGPSVSVLEASFSDGVATFRMQSGDTVTVVSPNYSFKRTPLRGAA
jgi:hypothetical protein